MSQVSLEELHEHTDEIVDRVGNGEDVTVTIDGTPVVVMSPIPPAN